MSPKAGTLYVLTDSPVDPHRWALPVQSFGGKNQRLDLSFIWVMYALIGI